MDDMERVIAPTVYIILAVIGMLGNGMVFYVMAVVVETKSVTDVYVTNLAAADLLFVSTLPFWASELFWNRWVFGEVMCKILSAVLYINMYGSVFFLAAMGIDRWIAVVRAVTSRKIRTVKRTRIIAGTIWAACLVIAIFPLIFRSVQEIDVDRERCVWNFPVNYRSLLNIIYTLSRTLLGFFIPLIILMVCYLSIIRFMIKRSKAKGKKYKGMSRITKLIAVVILCFTFAWLPNQITNCIHFMSLIGFYKYCSSSSAPTANIYAASYTERNAVTNESLTWIITHHTTESFSVTTTSPSYQSYLNPISDATAAYQSYQLPNVTTYTFNQLFATTASIDTSEPPISTCFRRIQLIHLITVCLGFANSVMNPIVYTCVGSALRKKLGLAFKCYRKDRSFRRNKIWRTRTLSTYLRSTIRYLNGDASDRTSRKQGRQFNVPRRIRGVRLTSLQTSDLAISVHGSATSRFISEEKTKATRMNSQPVTQNEKEMNQLLYNDTLKPMEELKSESFGPVVRGSRD